MKARRFSSFLSSQRSLLCTTMHPNEKGESRVLYSSSPFQHSTAITFVTELILATVYASLCGTQSCAF